MRRIFVGSSTESLDKAKSICQALSTVEDTECVLWKKFFEPGFLTFEALEEMLMHCCAAVFIATPDDAIEIRGKQMHSPRSNVLLEFGLVAGRLGRHSVAVCQYGGAELPSDLKGLTLIEMGNGGAEDSAKNKLAKEKLRIWASRLIATAETIPRTDLVHGYTGRWDFKLRLDKWRDLAIEFPNYVQVNGAFDLFIPSNGRTGRGLAHARLFFKVQGKENPDSDVFQGEFRTGHEITNAVCHKDGRIDFTSQAFVLQRVNSVGVPPPHIAGMDLFPEPWSSQWILCPSSEPRTLVGVVTTEGSGVSHGTVKATKFDLMT
jgi:hypothetical protein